MIVKVIIYTYKKFEFVEQMQKLGMFCSKSSTRNTYRYRFLFFSVKNVVYDCMCVHVVLQLKGRGESKLMILYTMLPSNML